MKFKRLFHFFKGYLKPYQFSIKNKKYDIFLSRMSKGITIVFEVVPNSHSKYFDEQRRLP